MGKKVRVTTKCGEEFFYDHDQEVDTVEIVEVPEESLFNEPQSKEDVRRMIEFLHGGRWRFRTNTDPENMDYFRYVRWLHNANICAFSVPENPHDIVITPYAFDRNGNRISGYNSLWSRFGATEVRPKKALGDHF